MLFEESVAHADDYSVYKRYDYRSDADADKFAEKQQRHHTGDDKAAGVKYTLEFRSVDLEVRRNALNEEIVDLGVKIYMKEECYG